MSSKWFLDWTDADNYECFNAKTAYEIFAWEFLRRNPQYQKDFDENKGLIEKNEVCFGIKKLLEAECGSGIYMKENMQTRYGLAYNSSNYDYRIDTPPIFDCLDYPSFSVPYEIENKHTNCQYAKKNSKKNTQEDHHIPEQKKRDIIVDMFDLPEEEPQPSEFNVYMSTDYDLNRQLKVIEDFFKVHQNKYPSIDKHDRPTYRKCLRILDALEVKASKSAMFKIYDDEKEKNKKEGENKRIDNETNNSTLNRHIQLAKKLRDGGYIRIVKSKIQFSSTIQGIRKSLTNIG